MDPPGSTLTTDYVFREREIHCESRVQSSAEAGRRGQEQPRSGGSRNEIQPEQQTGAKPPPPSSLPRFKDQVTSQSDRSIFPMAVMLEEAPRKAAAMPGPQQEASSPANRRTDHADSPPNTDLPRFKDQAMSRGDHDPQYVTSAIPVPPSNVYAQNHNQNNTNQISELSGPTFKGQMRESATTPMVSIQAVTTDGTQEQQRSLSRDAFIALQNDGFPSGLIQQLDALKQVYAARYWIVDNSGSMLKPDCVRYLQSSQRVVGCSRWDELCRTVRAHADLAARIHAPTFFRWLNDPGARLGPAEVCIQNEEDVQTLRRTMESIQPGGRTPLTQHIEELETRIRTADYGATGQKAVVVIATDGLPTDLRGESTDRCKTEFVRSLRRLGSLPVWIVVRLCTNDDEVIEYYRKLDGQLEFEIEVIDDFVNEAKQVERFNSWLGYGHPLHLCREMGFHVRLFDLFNERAFTLDEIEELAKILFGATQITHSVHRDYKAFCADVTNSIAPPSMCPIKLKKRPWIDLRKFKREGSVFGMFRERMSSVLSMGGTTSGIGGR